MPQIIAARIGHVAALLAFVFSMLSIALPIAAARADAPDRAGASGVIAQLGNGTLAILAETQPASSDRYGRFKTLRNNAEFLFTRDAFQHHQDGQKC